MSGPGPLRGRPFASTADAVTVGGAEALAAAAAGAMSATEFAPSGHLVKSTQLRGLSEHSWVNV